MLSQVGELVRSGQHQAALEFVAQHAADVAPPLTIQERTDVSYLLHIAQMTVDLADWAPTAEGDTVLAGDRSTPTTPAP